MPTIDWTREPPRRADAGRRHQTLVSQHFRPLCSLMRQDAPANGLDACTAGQFLCGDFFQYEFLGPFLHCLFASADVAFACANLLRRRLRTAGLRKGVSLSRKRGFFSIGQRDGRYVRVGRLVLWWYGFRRDTELCAVWWLDAGRRSATNGLTLKPPWCSPLYSENYGKHRPYVQLFGWRLLSIKHDR